MAVASDEGITGVFGIAAANGAVIDDLAASVLSAGARTRVHAFVLETSLCERALCTHHTFRPAVGWCADVARLARAHRHTIGLLTQAVRPAWRWVTWLPYHRCNKTISIEFKIRN